MTGEKRGSRPASAAQRSTRRTTARFDIGCLVNFSAAAKPAEERPLLVLPLPSTRGEEPFAEGAVPPGSRSPPSFQRPVDDDNQLRLCASQWLGLLPRRGPPRRERWRRRLDLPAASSAALIAPGDEDPPVGCVSALRLRRPRRPRIVGRALDLGAQESGTAVSPPLRACHFGTVKCPSRGQYYVRKSHLSDTRWASGRRFCFASGQAISRRSAAKRRIAFSSFSNARTSICRTRSRLTL